MKHKHADLIHAWADGAEIQYNIGKGWKDFSIYEQPSWEHDTEYRIKPEEKKPVVRWLWADACGNSSCCLLSEDEAKQITDHTIKLEWSRTEFPE